MIIKKDSLPLETQIRFLTGDLKRESDKLVIIESQLDKAKDETIRDLVVNDLADTIIRYSKTTQELRSKLEVWFTYEEKENLPRNLAFYKLYKNITKE